MNPEQLSSESKAKVVTEWAFVAENEKNLPWEDFKRVVASAGTIVKEMPEQNAVQLMPHGVI